MLGIETLFKKLLPIVLILCFIAFGINFIFNIQNLTYLTTETINNQTVYSYDFEAYIQNLNSDPIKTGITNTIDITTLTRVVNDWEQLWEDGYQLGDLAKTVINGFTLLADVVIMTLNLPVIIVRIIAGTIRTLLTLIGININANTIINNTLYGLNNMPTIPMITSWFSNPS